MDEKNNHFDFDFTLIGQAITFVATKLSPPSFLNKRKS